MTDIDQALAALRAAPRDHKAQSGFYDLFLNTSFFVPTIHEEVVVDDEGSREKTELPLILEDEGTEYLVFFDQLERLTAWAEDGAPCIKLPGHVLAEMTPDGLHWAMNIGTDYNKQFFPDEIAWLKDAVRRCKEEGGAQEV